MLEDKGDVAIGSTRDGNTELKGMLIAFTISKCMLSFSAKLRWSYSC
jgi:hypothetical protein